MRLPFGLWTIVGVLLLAGLVYAIIEPVSIFGYDADALGESLEGELPDSHGDSRCEELQQRDKWMCFTGINLTATYVLTVDDDGCWDAKRVAFGTDTHPPSEEEDGCVDLFDVTGLSGLLDV